MGLKAMLMTQLLLSDQMRSGGSICCRRWTLKAICSTNLREWRI
jgi:hypothetical protein